MPARLAVTLQRLLYSYFVVVACQRVYVTQYMCIYAESVAREGYEKELSTFVYHALFYSTCYNSSHKIDETWENGIALTPPNSYGDRHLLAVAL
jgi:hypothetical protein